MPNWSKSSTNSRSLALRPLHLDLAARRWDRLVTAVTTVALILAPMLVWLQVRGSFPKFGAAEWVMVIVAGALFGLGASFELRRLGWSKGRSRPQFLALQSDGEWSLADARQVWKPATLLGSSRTVGRFLVLEFCSEQNRRRILLGPGDLDANEHRRLTTRLNLKAALAPPPSPPAEVDLSESDLRHALRQCLLWANFLWNGGSTKALVSRRHAGAQPAVRNAGR